MLLAVHPRMHKPAFQLVCLDYGHARQRIVLCVTQYWAQQANAVQGDAMKCWSAGRVSLRQDFTLTADEALKWSCNGMSSGKHILVGPVSTRHESLELQRVSSLL